MKAFLSLALLVLSTLALQSQERYVKSMVGGPQPQGDGSSALVSVGMYMHWLGFAKDANGAEDRAWSIVNDGTDSFVIASGSVAVVKTAAEIEVARETLRRDRQRQQAATANQGISLPAGVRDQMIRDLKAAGRGLVNNLNKLSDVEIKQQHDQLRLEMEQRQINRIERKIDDLERRIRTGR